MFLVSKMDISKVCVLFLFTRAFGSSHRRLLMQGLLAGYDRLVGPEDSPVNVTHSLQLKRVISLEDQVLTLDAYISMQWQDSQLTWTPEDFGEISLIRIPSNMLWQPDIMLENNADQSDGVHRSNINVVVAYDGVVFYIPPVKIKSYCSVGNNKLRRNSEVTCSLKFMSWTNDGLSLNLETGPEGNVLSDFDNDFNKDWRLVSVSVKRNERKYPCCPEPYLDITYKLVLKKL